MNNFRNKLVSKKEIKEFFDFDIDIDDIKLYQRAFASQCFYEQLLTEKNCMTKENQSFEKSNETLELVGDSILGSIIVEYLEERFPQEREGFISLLKMNITNTQGLCFLAKRLGFSNWVLLSSDTEKSCCRVDGQDELVYGRENPEILENCFEAFLGALFTSTKNKFSDAGDGYKVARKFVVSLIEKHLDFSELILRKDNHKNSLQHYFHTRKWPLPTYTDLGMSSDKDDRFLYTRGIYIDRIFLSEQEINSLVKITSTKKAPRIKDAKILIGTGESYKKKNADQVCAKNILLFFAPEELELKLKIIN